MGKKNKKNPGGTGSDYFDYRYGVGEAKSLMKRYGVEGARSIKPENRGATPDSYNRSVKDVKKDIASAMMNDYDTRRSMEAAALMGNKDAKKFAKKGFKAGNIYDAYGTMRDLKKEYVGGGGMDGPKNRAGLTHALVSADRDALLEKIGEGKKEDTPLDKAKETFDTGLNDGLSPKAAKAFGYVDAYEDREDGLTEYGMTDTRFGNRQTQDEAAQEFADLYKEKVKGRLSPSFELDKIFS